MWTPDHPAQDVGICIFHSPNLLTAAIPACTAPLAVDADDGLARSAADDPRHRLLTTTHDRIESTVLWGSSSAPNDLRPFGIALVKHTDNARLTNRLPKPEGQRDLFVRCGSKLRQRRALKPARCLRR